VPIDNVRVISNTATGKTGVLLANKFTREGCRVTLLLGPVEAVGLVNKVKLKHFSFFEELSNLLKKELAKNYDIIIQAAAVSDFKPDFKRNKKISSHSRSLELILKPAPKIINSLRKLNPRSFLAGFKFEPGMEARKLIKEARKLIKEAGLDCVVANSLRKKRYSAYLVEKEKIYGPFLSKPRMADELVKFTRRSLDHA
jgi:phosphopantothenoylcysteine decarboxylase/phosphopantothenate--cysteine ligase